MIQVGVNVCRRLVLAVAHDLHGLERVHPSPVQHCDEVVPEVVRGQRRLPQLQRVIGPPQECGKLTAKLRDAVPVCFMVDDREVKLYKNIEIPAEIKHLEYCGFRFDVPEDGGAITFKIWFNEGILPEI